MPTEHDTTWPDGSPAVQLYACPPVEPAIPTEPSAWPDADAPTGASAVAVVASAGVALMLGCLFGLPLLWALLGRS